MDSRLGLFPAWAPSYTLPEMPLRSQEQPERENSVPMARSGYIQTGYSSGANGFHGNVGVISYDQVDAKVYFSARTPILGGTIRLTAGGPIWERSNLLLGKDEGLRVS